MGSDRNSLLFNSGSGERAGNSALNLPLLEIGALLRAYNLEPHKGLGQNFLADPSILRRIVESADLPPDASVLEVGPGLGSLTRYLASAARHVVAVELDSHLLPVLEEVLGGFGNVEIVQGDILALDPAALMGSGGYYVVANIPYNITSALIRHLLESQLKPRRLVLTVQREVAERICAAPGDMSLLALSVQVYGQPSVTMRIPAGAFLPPPKVDSAVVRVDLHEQPLIPAERLRDFFILTKAGFSQKRKTLRNALSGGIRLTGSQAEGLLRAAGIDPMRRAETLAMEEWASLVEVYRGKASA
jgi:16S rRNA (adenine1518-N6/adenine1519-N6)-dimethyltransferase